MYRLLVIGVLFYAALYGDSLESLLTEVKHKNALSKKINQQREAKFLHNVNEAKAQVKEMRERLKEAKNRSKQLKRHFSKNRQIIAKKRRILQQKSANVKTLFSLTKSEAKAFLTLLKTSLTSATIKHRKEFLVTLSAPEYIPTSEDIRKFWQLYLQEIIESGRITTQKSSVVDAQGLERLQDVTRVGLFSAFSPKGYVRFDEALGEYVELQYQPRYTYRNYILEYLESASLVVPMLIDPTRGLVFDRLAQYVTVEKRLEQGGVIGYIIVILGMVTLLFSLYKFITLWRIEVGVKRVLKGEKVKWTNPLSRVIAAYEKGNYSDIHTIEATLDSAILKELPLIESGLSMVKLVAAVAPLLGLLGTLTGMIETFDSITLFGTGEPKLMAGGISQALMTTVLGLVVAIPTLFIYNILYAKSRRIIEILTQQSSALVAQKLEESEHESTRAF